MTKLSFVAVTVALVVVAAMGCASGGTAKPATSRAARCPLFDRDSTFAKGGPVYRDCAVDQTAKLISQGRRADVQQVSTRSGCHSAELEFVVDKNGVPEVASAFVARTNDSDFADAMLATLSSWRYEPATLAGVPVRQIVSARQGVQIVSGPNDVFVKKGSLPPSMPPAASC